MAYLGFQSFQGKFAAQTSNDGSGTGLQLGLGPHVGGLIGFRFMPQVSLNAELTLDVPHADLMGATGSIDASRYAISVSPLYHVDVGAVDFIVGPKLGFWTSSFSQNDAFSTATLTYSGWMAGVNAGLYYKVGRIGLGGLASFDYASVLQGCLTDDFQMRNCGPNNSYAADKLLSFALVILF
jgi:hypothetical protein